MNPMPAGNSGHSRNGYSSSGQPGPSTSGVPASASQPQFTIPQPPVPGPMPHIYPSPYVEAIVNNHLQHPTLQLLGIPRYPVPPTTDTGPNRGESFYQTAIMNIADKIHEWTQIFEGPVQKPLTAQNAMSIKHHLEEFVSVEQNLLGAFNSGVLSIEGLYLISPHRRLLVEHIIALNIHTSIFLPFYVGLHNNTSHRLRIITDGLYQDRNSL